MAGATFGTDAPRRRRTSHNELSEKRPLFGFRSKNLSEITNFLLQALGRLPKDRAWHDHGPFVYRLGRQVFNLERGVRFPYGLPLVHSKMIFMGLSMAHQAGVAPVEYILACASPVFQIG